MQLYARDPANRGLSSDATMLQEVGDRRRDNTTDFTDRNEDSPTGREELGRGGLNVEGAETMWAMPRWYAGSRCCWGGRRHQRRRPSLACLWMR